MRRSMDVLRSVKKYLASDVLPDYEIRLASEEGAWERPFCRLTWTTPTSLIPHGPFQLECRRTLNIVCWPLEAANTDAARETAEVLTEAMLQGFAVGLHAESYARQRAHPFRIPLWDYEGVPMTEPVDDSARLPTDFISVVEEPSTGDIEDPDTELSRLVITDLRLRWMRSMAIDLTGPVVQTVGVSPAP